MASTSPRRVELLKQLGVDFKVVPSGISEIHHGELTAREISQINAYRKARAVAKKHPDSLVLGADTLVFIGTRVYGKPRDLEDAYRMLDELQGRTHQVVTAVCLLHLRAHRQRIFVEESSVTFHQLDSLRIRRYLQKIEPLDKAGAYAAQENGKDIIETVAGSYTNVVGLPLEILSRELQSWAGIPAFFPAAPALLRARTASPALGARSFAR
ncbi:MAG TPA: Maf family protein [Verrucomicrobiae bacterium]|nr:Maf family protein [Verrucomicrobiae bacterium]